MSLEFTAPLAVVSPTSTSIVAGTSFVFVPSLTFESVTMIVCALVTPVRFTVTTFPATLKLVTLPAPVETDALGTITSRANVKMSV